MTTAEPSSDDVKIHFAQLSVQYFIAGRTATFQLLIPTLGNLLHHAVEMSLKAFLAQSLNLQQLRQFGHNLPRLWSAFKERTPGRGNERLDSAVDALHRYESLRYPDSVVVSGAAMEVALFREHLPKPFAPSAVPRYPFVLEDTDELMSEIFQAANLNPAFFTGAASEEAKRMLRKDNRHCLGW